MAPHGRRKTGWFILGGLLVALLVAGVISNAAASDPDGLDAATRAGCTVDSSGAIVGGTCAAQGERTHELDDSPLAGYGFAGIEDATVANSLAGVLGVLLTFAVGGGLFWLVRTRQPATVDGGRPAASTAGGSTSASVAGDRQPAGEDRSPGR